MYQITHISEGDVLYPHLKREQVDRTVKVGSQQAHTRQRHAPQINQRPLLKTVNISLFAIISGRGVNFPIVSTLFSAF